VRFRIDPSRAQLAAKLLLGERPSFVTVSDRYAGYNHLPIEQRQVCWAHLLRDFERIAGRAGLGGRVGQRLLGYGCLLFRWRAADKPAQHFEWLQKRMRVQLELGSAQIQCSRTANTCANLIKMWPALWTFRKRSANPSSRARSKLRISSHCNQPMGRDEDGSRTNAALPGSGGGVPGLWSEGQSVGPGQWCA
jgi:hypothetical protein